MSDQIQEQITGQISTDTNGPSNPNKRKHKDDLLDNSNENNLELDESYVTMVDVLKEEEKLEEDAYAVLGGSDDKNCTYEQGYVNRQALYSCRTCMGDNSNEEADIFGICLACSYACHADHDLFELYTKRSFRCDCGTSKMKKRVCVLNPNKDSLNHKNNYNHNFIGKYCICDKPYPNLEGNDEEMAQCIICEDWFHQICLDTTFPEDYAELTCESCLKKNPYLWFYQPEKATNEDVSKDTKVDVASVEGKEIKENLKEEIKDKEVKADEIKDKNVEGSKEEENDKLVRDKNVSVNASTNDEQIISNKNNETKHINENSVESSILAEQVVNQENVKLVEEVDKVENGHLKSIDLLIPESGSTNECKLRSLKLRVNIEGKKGTAFWDEDWRSQLCKCEECLKIYKEHKTEFLIDEQDTVHYYEAKGKEKCQRVSQYERGLDEICKINHVVGIEAIMEYKNMSNEFKEHFKKFAEDKKVIEQKHIEEFFQTLKYKKKMKLDHPSF